MKKKLALLVLAICTVMACSISFVACNITVPVDFELQFIVDGEVYATIDTAGEETISLPANPKKDGFEFDGWYWDENTWERPFTANSLLNEKLTSDMRVYAKWKDAETEKQEYVVTFNSMGGTAIDSVTVTEGSLLARPAEPSYTGFVFNGWYKDEDCTVSWVFETDTVTSSITLYAGWIEETATTFTVTYKDGETVLYTRKVAENNTAENIAVTKEGHTFKGWLLNNAEYDFTVPVTEDIILVAKWEINTYTVTFIADGVEIERFIVDYLDSVPEIPIVPAKTGYTGAWSITDFSSIAKNLTVTALYTAKTYTAAFDYANADGGNTIQNITLTYGQPVGALPVPTKADNTFYGWFYEGTQVTASTIWQTDTSAQITFTAKWLAADNGHAIISSDYFEFTEDDTVLRLPEKLRNLTETYDLIGKFTVSAGATWTAYTDESCSNDSLITREDLAPLTAEGWNNIYIQVKNQATREYTIYTLQIYRNKRIPVSLYYNESVLYKTAMLEETVPASDEANGDRLSFTLTDYSCDGNFYTDSACTNEWSTATVITEPISLYIKAYCHAVTVNSSGTVTGMSKQSGKVRLVIPESKNGTEITAIGTSAFKDKTNLIFVEVPGSVTKITFGAFSGCAALERISLPFVGTNANDVSGPNSYHPVFGEIFGATKYNGSISYYGYYIPTSLKSVEITGQYIRSYAFSGFTGLKNIYIGRNVERIADNAFEGCTNLKSVHISDLAAWCNISFDSTEANPLIYANNLYLNEVLLQELIIPEGVTEISSFAFSFFKTLKSITIPSTVESIGDDAFYNCTGLTEIVFNAVNAEILSNGGTFFNAGSNSEGIDVVFGETVVTIPDYLFFSAIYPPNIKNVKIGSNVTSIGQYAFSDCSGLTEISIPNSVTSIGESAFSGCSSLTSIDIPNSVTNIGDYSFSGCSSLTSITIPSEVTSIGESAFSDCTGLTEICYNAAEVILSNNTFSNAGIDSEGINVVFGETVVAIPDYLFYTEVGNTSPNITSVTIGNNVTSIGERAFSGCAGLTKIVIPSSVTNIGNSAFSGCAGLTQITIPSSVTSIGESAFSDCTSLTSVTIPNSVTSIGQSTFSDCTSLMNIIISDGVTSIEDNAFSGCSSLTNITIPDSVTSIGTSALRDCDSLTSITIPFVGETIDGTRDTEFGHIFGASYGIYYNQNVPKSLKSVIITGGTRIGSNAFKDCSSITSITIPDSITNIGNDAFSGCSSLSNVYVNDIAAWCGIEFGNSSSNPLYYANTLYLNGEKVTELSIPDGVTSIGQYAFYGFAGLTKITVPNSVKSIAWSAFENCPIESATIPTLAISYVLNKNLKEVVITGGEIIEDSTFRDCTSLTSITILAHVTSIGDAAFMNCASLTSITMPSSVTDIGWRAFSDCSSLTNIVIPDSVTSIGESAFSDCASLTSITIPNSVTSIGVSAFKGCTKLVTVDFGENSQLKLIRHYLFEGCTSLRNIEIPSGVWGIAAYAFNGCNSLRSIIIPSSVDEIGNLVFKDCTMLKEVYITDITAWCELKFYDSFANPLSNGATLYLNGKPFTKLVIPESMTSIGSYVFYGCSWLTSIDIPASVTSIGSYAFYGCSSLTNINIPSSIKSIGGEAFYGCNKIILQQNGVSYVDNWVVDCDTSVTEVSLEKDTVGIAERAFDGCVSLTSLTIPNDVTRIGDLAFRNCPIENATIPTIAIDYISNKSLKKVVITGGESIDGFAFGGCASLESITIPNSVTSIGYHAFYGCASLESITIPSSVTSIGKRVFRNCIALATITVENGNPVYHSAGNCIIETEQKTLVAGCKTSVIPSDGSVTKIGDMAFDCRTSLTSITIPDGVTSIGEEAFSNCTSLTSIAIPDSVTSIGIRAFYGCTSLTSIVIPDSITSIKNYTFDGCDSLESVYYVGTAEEWSAISIGSNNTPLTSATVYCYSESEPPLNTDGTAYDGSYWRYVDGVPAVWIKETN